MFKLITLCALVSTSSAINSHHRHQMRREPLLEREMISQPVTLDADISRTLNSEKESEAVWKHGMTAIPTKEE